MFVSELHEMQKSCISSTLLKYMNLSFLCSSHQSVFHHETFQKYCIHLNVHAYFFQNFLNFKNMFFRFFQKTGSLELGIQKSPLSVSFLFHFFTLKLGILLISLCIQANYWPIDISC